MSIGEREGKIELYGDAYRILMEALARLPKEMWHFKASPDDWSVHGLDTYARHIPDHVEQMERGYAAWARET